MEPSGRSRLIVPPGIPYDSGPVELIMFDSRMPRSMRFIVWGITILAFAIIVIGLLNQR